MAKSKQSKERADKKAVYKEGAKQKAAQQKIPKTHLVPLTEWQSTDILDLRGDLLEALEHQIVLVFQGLQQIQQLVQVTGQEFQKGAQVIQMIMQQNIKEGKIKLKYKWNNDEAATEQEVAEYEKKAKEIQEQRIKEFKEAQEKQKAQENAGKTGLVGPDGSPVGSTQELEDEGPGNDEGQEEAENDSKTEQGALAD